MGNIKIKELINCTWKLDGENFYCQHDEIEVVVYYEDHLGINGHYETEHRGCACVECGEPLDGDPDADRQDYIAESQLMEILAS